MLENGPFWANFQISQALFLFANVFLGLIPSPIAFTNPRAVYFKVWDIKNKISDLQNFKSKKKSKSVLENGPFWAIFQISKALFFFTKTFLGLIGSPIAFTNPRAVYFKVWDIRNKNYDLQDLNSEKS